MPQPPAPEGKKKKKQLGKTKSDLAARAEIIIRQIVKGATEKDAIIAAGYTESSAIYSKTEILQNPQIQKTFREFLDRAGVTDDRLARKVSLLLDAKDTKFFSHQGIVTDQREVENLAIQAQMLEFAAKIKGHLVSAAPDGAPAEPGTHIDLRRYQVNVQVNELSGSPTVPQGGDNKTAMVPDMVALVGKDA